MKALTVIPLKAGSAELSDVDDPPETDGPVLVETLAIGICGTDAEILSGAYGWPPPGRERLVSGAGTPILFLHEFAADYSNWEPQLRYFSRGHRCIAYSARGYTPSDVPEAAEVYTFQHFYRDALAVLFGNLAPNGAIVKTAGVDPSLLQFTGPAHIFESQDDAVDGILNDAVKPGEVVVIRYEGPKGGPGMQEMLYPTSYLKSKGLAESCALITDGRFSGGSSGLSVCHISPEAADRGAIGLIQNGDLIRIDIPARVLLVACSDDELAERRKAMDARADAWHPVARERSVSAALQAYAALTTSADRGAVRDVSQVARRR